MHSMFEQNSKKKLIRINWNESVGGGVSARYCLSRHSISSLRYLNGPRKAFRVLAASGHLNSFLSPGRPAGHPALPGAGRDHCSYQAQPHAWQGEKPHSFPVCFLFVEIVCANLCSSPARPGLASSLYI